MVSVKIWRCTFALMSYWYRGGAPSGMAKKGRAVSSSLHCLSDCAPKVTKHSPRSPRLGTASSQVLLSDATSKAVNARHYDLKTAVSPRGQDTKHSANAALQATKKDKNCS